jgi:hypothetical protein
MAYFILLMPEHYVGQIGHHTLHWPMKCAFQTQEVQWISCPQGHRVYSMQMTQTFSSSSCSSWMFLVKSTSTSHSAQYCHDGGFITPIEWYFCLQSKVVFVVIFLLLAASF